MLSQVAAKRVPSLRLVALTQQRGFFDYLSEVNKKPGQEAPEQVASRSKFDWQLFQKLQPVLQEQDIEKFKRAQATYQKFESFVNQGSAKTNATIDWEKYRSEIADPTFVDELEIKTKAEAVCLKSVENMETVFKWKPDAVDKFKQELEQTGNLLLRPLTKEQRQEVVNQEPVMEKQDRQILNLVEDMQKDYEQLDAHRTLNGQNTLMMDLAECPHAAESYEDFLSGVQTIQEPIAPQVDESFWADYLKYSRMKSIRDDSQRAEWLKQFDQSSKMQGYINSF